MLVKVPSRPPQLIELMSSLEPAELTELLDHINPVDSRGRYLHWDDMRNRTPPADLTQEQWWLGTAFARQALARNVSLRGSDGSPFRFCNIDLIQEVVHRIDQQASGQILSEGLVTNLRSSDRYLVSSLVEEAITSSQLEGASTTRQVAKQLLATGRKPRDRSEQMIVNNYQAMIFAQELAGRPLTATDVLDLHRLVTADALDDPRDAGRLQKKGEERIAVYWYDDTLLHAPPDATELPARLESMCRFANGEVTGGFIHPVVRAIILHFWLAHDHPFVDGNGRTARALFYWAMLRQGYWLTQYLTISSILREAPARYAKSFLLTETDNNDLTYFVIYQLQVIERAIDSLHEYLARKTAEHRELEALLNGSPRLNHRQLTVIRDALRDPSEPFTAAAQGHRHRVSTESARSDLLGLERLNLLSKERVSKKFVFRAVRDLPARLRELSARP
ncbi:MAG: Fic family protein [Acidimicrobiales bacterium]